MFEPKIPGVAAAVGFVLSFLTGLFSGAAFAVALFRAIAIALLFGAGAAVVYIIVRKFLPELFESDSESYMDNSAGQTGNVVDLSIGDQDDSLVSPFSVQPAASAGTADATAAEAPDRGRLSPDETSSGNESDDGVSPGSDESSFAEAPVSGETVADGSGQTAPQNGSDVKETATAASQAKPAEKPKPKGAVAGLDVLPDLQDFIPNEKVPDEQDSDGDISEPSSGTGFSVADVATDGMETETMAKAIRTILSKDN